MADETETKRGPDDKRAHDESKTKGASQQALAPDAAGNVMIEAIAGPYRNQRLTVPAAEGQTAINDHWARDPHSGEEYGTGHDALSDEERAHALEAANTWAQTQWDAGTQEPPPPEGGEGETGGVTRRRAMTPDQGPGYATRRNEPQQPPRKP